MKYIKLYETFSPYDDEPLTRSEEIFGKQTRLEKQFSEIVVNGLCSDDNNVSDFWSTFNALTIRILEYIKEDDIIYKEMMHKIIEGSNPVECISFVCSKLNVKDEEIDRLLNKLNNL